VSGPQGCPEILPVVPPRPPSTPAAGMSLESKELRFSRRYRGDVLGAGAVELLLLLSCSSRMRSSACVSRLPGSGGPGSVACWPRMPLAQGPFAPPTHAADRYDLFRRFIAYYKAGSDGPAFPCIIGFGSSPFPMRDHSALAADGRNAGPSQVPKRSFCGVIGGLRPRQDDKAFAWAGLVPFCVRS